MKTPLSHIAGRLLPLFAITLALSACTGDYTPKPKAYPRVAFPEKKYEVYNPANCPFTFEKPVYVQAVADTQFFNQRPANDCWLNLQFASLNGVINLTYKDINAGMTIEQLVEDAHTLTYKHTKKADYIDEVPVHNQYGVGGLVFEVGGDAASNLQFFLTDSTRHFIRGALYFNNAPNTDSMAPVVAFVKEDLRHLLSTFRWK